MFLFSEPPIPRIMMHAAIHRFHGLAMCGAWLAAAAMLTSCGTRETPEAVDEDPVALEVGDRAIRLSELQADVDLLRERRSPGAASMEAFLEPSIERLVALEQARAAGLDQDVSLRRQWENMLIGRLRELEIEAQVREIEVTDAEVEERFGIDSARHTRPAQVRLGLMFLAVSPNASDEARADIRARMEEGRTLAADLPEDTRGFGALAMTYSEEATSRFRGGDIGWLQEGEGQYRWPDAVVVAGFSLENHGDVSEIIEEEDGLYLLKLLDSRDPQVRQLDDRLRTSIAATIAREKRTEVEERLIRKWRENHPVVEHQEILESLIFDDPQPEPISQPDIPASP